MSDSYFVYNCPHEKLDPYRSMIYAKWLRSMRYGNEYAKLIEQTAYFKYAHDYITRLLDNPKTVIKLAVLTDDIDVVLGFSVIRGKVLDYVYVHRDQRRLGIGASLVPDDIETFSNLTKVGLIVWKLKYPHLKFVPYL